MEDLCLYGVEELELALIQRFKLRIAERVDGKWTQRLQLRVREVLVGHIQLREVYRLIVADVVPAVRQHSKVVVLACSDAALTWLDLVRDEKGEADAVFVPESRAAFLHVLLQHLEELGMQYLELIVYHHPKRLALAVPAVGPLKIGDKMQLNLENASSDRLTLHVDVEVRDIARQLV